MPDLPLHLHRNAHEIGEPSISIVMPFFRDNPARLLKLLSATAFRKGLQAEFIIADDGSCDRELTHTLMATIDSLELPATLITISRNQGRAATRNILGKHAVGAYILFLDADVMPDKDTFLQVYMDFIDSARPSVIIGGFSVNRCKVTSEVALHHYLTSRVDCLPAAARNDNPWRYCFSCNVLVRRDIFLQHPFNGAYRGWGWEDQEWGLRVSRQYPLVHIDNTVTNAGLNDEITLMRKYAESGATFRQILRDHPDDMRETQAYKAYLILRWIPGHRLLIRPLAFIVCQRLLPMRVRASALRIYRALHYVKS